MERYNAAVDGGADAAKPAYGDAHQALLRELNANNPGGCARAVATAVALSPLALRSSRGNTIALATEGVVNLGRRGLLHGHTCSVFVEDEHATLVISRTGLRVVAQGRNPTAVVSEQGKTFRLEKKGDVTDVSIGDSIVLRPDAPEGEKEVFELVEVMDVEAPAAASEPSQSPAAVDQVQAAALTSDAPMAAPRPAATGRDQMSDLDLVSAPAAPADELSGAATQRSLARVDEPHELESTDYLARRLSSGAVSVSRQDHPKRKDFEDGIARNRHKAQAGDKSGETAARFMKDTPSKKKHDNDSSEDEDEGMDEFDPFSPENVPRATERNSHAIRALFEQRFGFPAPTRGNSQSRLFGDFLEYLRQCIIRKVYPNL